MGDLTAHFSASEFISGDGARRDPPCRLLAVLEAVRAIAGRPVRILSGYRTSSWNAKVGGVSGSQHLAAAAADIPPGLVTEEQARRAGATGVGVDGAGWAVHVDVGPVRTWRY